MRGLFMPKLLLLLLWPIMRRLLLKRGSEYVADFLNRRREQRLNPPEEPSGISSDETAGCPAHIGYGPTDIVWFTLSGVLLGSALGVLVSYLARPEE
jgi:hypothetical protein